MNYTTIEQSKKLLELGLNPDTADMHFIKIIRDTDTVYIPELLYDDPLSELDYPCWSLGALLELIPHTGFEGIELNNYNDDKTIWTAIFHRKTDSVPIKIADTSLDAVYEVVVYLLENGYIKREPKTPSE